MSDNFILRQILDTISPNFLSQCQDATLITSHYVVLNETIKLDCYNVSTLSLTYSDVN